MLAPATAREMLTRKGSPYGLGFDLAREGSGRVLRHSGVNAGDRARLAAFVEVGEGAVVMPNRDGGFALADEILRSLAGAYQWPGAK